MTTTKIRWRPLGVLPGLAVVVPVLK